MAVADRVPELVQRPTLRWRRHGLRLLLLLAALVVVAVDLLH